MFGFLKFIFWFLFFYYLVKIVFRLITPLLLKQFANKMQDRFRRQQEQYYNTSNNQKQAEGKVIIDKNNNTSTSSRSEGVGDYVDFEEIEED